MQPINNRGTQSKINGAKSNGPTTDAGRSKCANSSLKHGMFASRVVLDNEDPAIYQSLREAFLNIFKPIDAFEHECVIAMVNARWKFRRLEAAETAEMNLTMAENRPQWNEDFEELDAPTQHAIALRKIGKHLETLVRYQEQQHRTVERNFNLLSKYRRKTGRTIPSRDEMAQAESEALHPKTEQGPDKPATLLTRLASFLLIFAMLLLTPLNLSAKSSALSHSTAQERRINHR